jgi:dTDP-4-dehydrorhamnose reductase
MRFLVLGASGMAGHIITLYLKEAGHKVVGLTRSPVAYCENIVCDIENFEKLSNIINNNDFDVVINAIGILNQYAELNKTKAILINSYLPHFLAEITSNTNKKVIHLSTDCVFSGKKGGYIEQSLRDGDTFYDRSKALGELDNSKDLTFRNSIIGPDSKAEGIGLFNWFMRQTGKIDGYTSAIWNGVTTLTLAKAIEQAAYCNLTGLYHLVNNNSISKYDLLRLFNKHFKGECITIQPSERIISDKTLINTRIDFRYHVPSFEEMISEQYLWIQNHRDLYAHYFKE